MSMADKQAAERLVLIMGREGVNRVGASSVMVLGLGGVGSNCVTALARGGVGRLILVDHDVVQASNINRQAVAFHSTLGRKKTEVMADIVADINPDATVCTTDAFVQAQDVPSLINKYADKLDYVIDALDTISTKLALACYADQTGIPLISSMGAGNKLYPECFHIADLYETRNCPLCRVMRREARKQGIGSLRVLYSSEHPVAVPVREGATRRERSNLGTASFVPPIMGQMIAGEVIRSLTQLDVARAPADK